MFAEYLNDGRVAIVRGNRVLRVFLTMAAAIAFLGSAHAADKKPSAFRECQTTWAEKKADAGKYGYFHYMSDCLKGKNS
jgi:hypothetical protein